MSAEQTNLTGEHEKLQRLTGEWEGSTKTWFDPTQPPADESPQQGTIRPILDGRFVQHEYRSRMGGEPFQGMAIIGYDANTQAYQCAWIDSFHMDTGIMFSEGDATAQGLSVLGSYLTEADEEGNRQRWGWRTQITIIGEDQISITHYNRTPDGQEAKGVETLYTRKK